MAMPALRQPKLVTEKVTKLNRVYADTNYVILTLKNKNKLVVTSDAYHGILVEEEWCKCVFCAMTIELNDKYMELHKCTPKHKELMADVPYIEDFSEHLLRQINKAESYCTICNVLIPTHTVARHISTEAHMQELEKAHTRGLSYKPYS